VEVCVGLGWSWWKLDGYVVMARVDKRWSAVVILAGVDGKWSFVEVCVGFGWSWWKVDGYVGHGWS
jgi:hypothetical protein